MNLNACLENYIAKLNESIALGKPFSEITKEDVIDYLKYNINDGQLVLSSSQQYPIVNPSHHYPDKEIDRLIKNGGIDECVDFIKHLHFPLKVFRALWLNSDTDLDAKTLGNHWTINSELFFSRNNGLAACNDETYPTHIIIGQIDNQDNIDLAETLDLYLEFSISDYVFNEVGYDEPEDEVFIPDPSKIKILAVMPFEDFKRSRMRY